MKNNFTITSIIFLCNDYPIFTIFLYMMYLFHANFHENVAASTRMY